MEKKIKKYLSNFPGDYADVRMEKGDYTVITFHGPELKTYSSYTREGGHLRIFSNGGKATGSFTDHKQIPGLLTELNLGSQLIGQSRKKPIKLKPAPVIKARYKPKVNIHPGTISLKQKLELLEHYNQILLGDKIVNFTEISFIESIRHKSFFNTEGTEITQEIVLLNIIGRIFGKGPDTTQQLRVGIGGNEDYATLLNRESHFETRCKILDELIKAEPIKAGNYPVILDPSEAGVFIHEAFGHLSEADIIQNNPAFRKEMYLNRKLGRPILNVIDDGSLPGYPGSYKYDDEGVEAGKTYLIKNGILSGRMHSRETAEDFNEELSGNCRAQNSTFTPIIRMSNIYIDKGETEFDDMVSSIDDGYYLLNAKGGQTMGDQFSFGAQYGYKIKAGKIAGMVRDINMSGNLFTTLERISMVGNDIRFSEVGGCGKGGQIMRKSGKGAPHIKIDEVTIGGV